MIPRTKVYYMLTREAGGTIVFYKERTPTGWLDRFETREAAENARYWAALGDSNRDVIYDIIELDLPNPDYKDDI